MGKNFGKGGKGHKRLKNNNSETSRELIFKGSAQDYAVVKDMLGNGRCNAVCFDDAVTKLCIIRGNMRVRQVNRICKGDLVLVGLREYQHTKVDIIHIYTNDEVKSLIGYGEISDSFANSSEHLHESDDTYDNIIFENI